METLAERRHLNIFEAAMKMGTAEQTTPPRYALIFIDDETVKSV